MTACLCVPGAEKMWRLDGQDFEVEFSLRVGENLEPKIYPLLSATRRKTVFGAVLRKYADKRALLFNTARFFEDGKPFVTEFSYNFEPERTYTLKIRYADGKVELFLDGKLMKSRPFSGKFAPGELRNTSGTPVTAEIKCVKGASEKQAPPQAAVFSGMPWRITGSGLDVKPAGKGLYLVTFEGRGQRGVLWSTKKVSPVRNGEHVRVSGQYKVLDSAYGSMFRMRINGAPHRPVLTM